MATTTPNYGWSVPTSSDYVAQGAVAIETLGDSVDATLFTALGGAYPGMRLVKTQAIGTGVSTIVVNSAFSSTYENYKILISGGSGSTTANLKFQLNGITTGYYSSLIYQAFNSTTVTGAITSNDSTWNWCGSFTTATCYSDFNIQGPQLATAKRGHAQHNELSATAISGTANFFNASTTQATGFTIFTTGGTISSGLIAVYGYGRS